MAERVYKVYGEHFQQELEKTEIFERDGYGLLRSVDLWGNVFVEISWDEPSQMRGPGGVSMGVGYVLRDPRFKGHGLEIERSTQYLFEDGDWVGRKGISEVFDEIYIEMIEIGECYEDSWAETLDGESMEDFGEEDIDSGEIAF